MDDAVVRSRLLVRTFGLFVTALSLAHAARGVLTAFGADAAPQWNVASRDVVFFWWLLDVAATMRWLAAHGAAGVMFLSGVVLLVRGSRRLERSVACALGYTLP